MPRRFVYHTYKDWSEIPQDDSLWQNADLTDAQLLYGIHPFDGKLWTSGYVGIGRLFNRSHKTFVKNGVEHLISIESRFNINPWHLLREVLLDDEFDQYASEVSERGDFFFKVYWDQGLVPVDFNQYDSDNNLLAALSFVDACFDLCRRGLKSSMQQTENNYTSKVKGKIDVSRNLKINTTRGRNDRFYCRHIDFSIDTIENRVLKAALNKSVQSIQRKSINSPEIAQRICFCSNSLKRVKSIPITAKELSCLSASGLYSYYNPVLLLAKCILNNKSISSSVVQQNTKTTFVVPFLINMELVFEFFIRSLIKKCLQHTDFILIPYARKYFLEKGIDNIDQVVRGIHLMPYCIPDIIIMNKKTNRAEFVLDAKYKPHDRVSRQDSLQLLAYILLTGARKCGFIFPGKEPMIKPVRDNRFLCLSTPFNDSLPYYELLLGDSNNERLLKDFLNLDAD